MKSRLCDWRTCQNHGNLEHSFIHDNYRWMACGHYHLQLLLERHREQQADKARKAEHARRMLQHLEKTETAARSIP
jgi:hypothetical protein